MAAAIEQLLRDAPEARVPDAVRQAYHDRAYAPLWFDNGLPRPRARELLARIGTALEDGLRPEDYPVPAVVAAAAANSGAGEIARADVAFSGTFVAYTSDLVSGRFDPGTMDPKWRIPRDARSGKRIAVEVAADPARVMDDLAPSHPVYGNLRRALAEHLDMQAAGGWPLFPATGPRRLEVGDRDSQVMQLRDRLRITDGPLRETADPELFDAELAEALKRFQRRHGLNEDGILGRRTRAALAVPIEARIVQLRVAMERWRWMPRDLGGDYVLVNVPAQRLWVYESDSPVLSMRTIVGRYKRQTPTFASTITYFVLRPKWYVPNSIAVKDLVPKAQKDPEYYRRGGYAVFDKATGERLDPDAIDWNAYGEGQDFPYRLVQDAGDDNALGNIKFMFPNPYGVYLHDTSSPRLFAKDDRFFSSGCIRVEKPLELASRILSLARPTTSGEIETLIAASPVNRHLTLEKQMPLYVVYMTAWADEQRTYFYEDVYRRDGRLLAALSN